MSSSDISFFEGAEKLLEIWFARKDRKVSSANDLRRIPRWSIKVFLDEIGCKIVSFRSSSKMDAYVLSESSLFICQQHLILKTCGEIAQLRCISKLLELASVYAGFDCVEDVFYSRKNFMRPELQPMPHKKFEEEVLYLDNYFNDELVYKFGKYRESNWFLYTLNKPKSVAVPDQTIEIMMTQLDSPRSRAFKLNRLPPPNEKDEHSYLGVCRDLKDFFENCEIDEHLFEPCGYSCNALLDDADKYFTIHITPEDGFSYASFECNAHQAFSQLCIERVIKCFQPLKFIITMFANQQSRSQFFVKEAKTDIKIFNYELKDFQICSIKNYTVAYLFFVKSGIS